MLELDSTQTADGSKSKPQLQVVVDAKSKVKRSRRCGWAGR